MDKKLSDLIDSGNIVGVDIGKCIEITQSILNTLIENNVNEFEHDVIIGLVNKSHQINMIIKLKNGGMK